MKTLATLVLAAAISIGCAKSGKNEPQQNGVVLPIETRTQAALEWNDFRNASNDELDAAKAALEDYRAKIYFAKNKVKIRRIINKNEYRLDKLRRELYDHDIWFENHILTYTEKNAMKIDAFKKEFSKKLDIIKAEIKACNC